MPSIKEGRRAHCLPDQHWVSGAVIGVAMDTIIIQIASITEGIFVVVCLHPRILAILRRYVVCTSLSSA